MDKAKNDKFFNCNEEQELQHVSGLYEESEKVYQFLKRACKTHGIYHSTHEEVYRLIERELGYAIPVEV